MNYSEIKQEKETRMSALVLVCGVFFAFSDKQFDENKTVLFEGEKYVSIGAGGYMPKSKTENWLQGLKDLEKFGKDEVKKAKLEDVEILYELQNHECFYVGSPGEVIEMFAGKYTSEKIWEVYRKNFNKEMAEL